MNLSPLPKTPVRTPQTGTSAKTLQLTPIWETVLKSQRIPPEVNENSIFHEISSRLEDLEWPVRQHAFRVLYDLIPVVSKDRLDERIIQNGILNKLIVNLGHPAPGVRKVAMETIRQYLKQTRYSEKMLESFVMYGVNDEDSSDAEDAGIVRENVILGTIIALVDVLKPFIFPENGGYAISQHFLNKIVAILSEKMKSPLYQEKCSETLWKLREMVGENRFLKTLDYLPDKELLNLIRLREMHDKMAAEETKTKGVTKKTQMVSDSDQSFEMELENSVTTFHDYKMLFNDEERVSEAKREESTEDFSDGTDTDTYTKETPAEQKERFVGLDEAVKEETGEEGKDDSCPASPRVVLETEIQFSEDKAIKMTIVEDEKDSEVKGNEIDLFPVEERGRESSAERRFVTEDGDLIMKILHNSEAEEFHEEERKRTPRRVRFGGEVIKLRTPDSDATDVTVEIREAPPMQEARPTTSHGRGQRQEKPVDALKIKTVDTLVIQERPKNQSLIPLPISPATKAPKCKSKSPVKLPSIPFGDTGSMSKKAKEVDDGVGFWKWSELGLLKEEVMANLKNQEDWKIEHQALEELKLTLIDPKVIQRMGNAADETLVRSLIKCLLQKLPETNNHQITTLCLAVILQLIRTLPVEVLKKNLVVTVEGLCKYVGGCKNVNLKIESVQSLKMLFSILGPSSVIDVLLENCLTSSSSKMRENAMLAIMYATMTFPSNLFDTENILNYALRAVADPRRRVRHAALEAISILSQFCASDVLNEKIGKVANTLPCNVAKTNFASAIQARISRRVLPTVSNEGLVLYSLQIPASRRFGSTGTPSGTDVDWILSGTGSVSTGSARSRVQLNAAQRLDGPPFSPSKWRNNQCLTTSRYTEIRSPERSSKKSESENPWTKQKIRTEASAVPSTKQENWKNRGSRLYGAQDKGRNVDRLKYNSSENLLFEEGRKNRFYPVELAGFEGESGLKPEEMSWALVPVSSLEEQQLARIRNNQIWTEYAVDNGGHFISSPLGTLRPLYLKIQPAPEYLSRSTDDVRRGSFSYASHRGQERHNNEDFTQIRVLTPSILREKNRTEDISTESNAAVPRKENAENRIPPLQPVTTTRNSLRQSNVRGSDRKLPDDNYIKPITQNGVSDSPPVPSGVLFPNIHGQDQDFNIVSKPKSAQYQEIDEGNTQETVTQLDGLLPTSRGSTKSIPIRSSDVQPLSSVKPQSVQSETVLHNFRSPGIKRNKDFVSGVSNAQNKLFDVKPGLPATSVASAPALINSSVRDQTPSTSSSNSTEFSGVNDTGIRLQRLSNGALDNSNFNQKLKLKGISKNNKVSPNGNPFPDTLKPFERPKEALDTCLSQLESQQWEVVMLGLTGLVRLLRHHPTIVTNNIHAVIVCLGRQIRNLRSQVSRAACQAASEMFVALKRNVEIDLEELAGPLFHRCADTNRFIRSDCGHALDNMTDNVSPARAVNVIISKGSMHQNAIVRTVAARLLLRLSEKIGADRVLSMPRETRDKIVQTGANLLMEGKLETRSYAKELFRLWSSNPSFSNLMLEAIPPNVMRHISKTLISLKA